MTKKLTLGLGVRWDLFTPDFQKYYHKGWIDASTAAARWKFTAPFPMCYLQRCGNDGLGL